ncbi:SAM-dependent methyltransferase [Anaerobacillus arseniciselenatis]|uniref:SAM-dependent methyltransferase n=1 Tax=Anaerobacillus arseniciselenatis TaxID=85682 RepID=A0A1S2L5R9_9BACI|nr:class I SAM-dependent methyltransferase [Anaerobacillus arseniciselenatis]OIJ07696.1 SAM-dependent methyltransferase [Anaerobacillus arseniciselenatis]
MNPWDKKFNEEGYFFGTEANVFIKEWGKRISKGKILAIAEGEGRNATYLASLGHHVTTWDYSKVGIEKTLQLASEKGVTVNAKLNDLEIVEWDENKWDAIVKVFGHLPPEVKTKTFAGIKKSLKPGGLYVTEVYSTKQIEYGTGGPKITELLYEPKMFLEAFSDWKFIHFFYGEVERYEGENHTGLCHVIQAVIQKPLVGREDI